MQTITSPALPMHIKPYWYNSIPTLRVPVAAKLLGVATPTLRSYITQGTMEALRWYDNTWRVSARALAAEMHRRTGVYRIPGNATSGEHLASSLEEQTLLLSAHMGELEPRAATNNDGTMRQLYTVPYEERRFHLLRLREASHPVNHQPQPPTEAHVTKVAHLSNGDRIEAAFPRGTTTAQAAHLVAEGWLVLETELIDHPERHPHHIDGTPVSEEDMAQRHQLTITAITPGQSTAHVKLTMKGGTTGHRDLAYTSTVRTLR